MALAEYAHHSSRGQRKARAGEGDLELNYTAKIRTKPPPHGAHPGVLAEPVVQVWSAAPRCPDAGVPLLSAPLLADTVADAVDQSAVTFLLQAALLKKKEEEDEEMRQLEAKEKEKQKDGDGEVSWWSMPAECWRRSGSRLVDESLVRPISGTSSQRGITRRTLDAGSSLVLPLRGRGRRKRGGRCRGRGEGLRGQGDFPALLCARPCTWRTQADFVWSLRDVGHSPGWWRRISEDFL